MVNKRIRMFPTIEDWAVKILSEAGCPMNYRDIANGVMLKRPIGGSTPFKSVYAVLIRSSRIKSMGDGMFELVHSQNDKKSAIV